MPLALRIAARFLLFTALYVVGAWIAQQFIAGKDEVALFWPSAGIALAVVIRYGLAWVAFVPFAVLLMHLWFAPVPNEFLPYSMAGNTLGTAIGGWLAARVAERRRFTLLGGLRMIPGAIVMGAVSAAVGVPGMLYSGMIPASALVSSILEWTMGDVLGIVCVAPLVLMATAPQQIHPDLPTPEEFGGPRETAAWITLLLMSFLLVYLGATFGSPYGLGLTALPLGLLIWSAVRFQPLWTVAGTAAALMVLTWMMGLGIAGFHRPQLAIDKIILLVFLSVIAIMPVMLSAITYERRISARKLLRRATTDRATGLPNRLAFEEALRRALHADGMRQSLAYLDLDNVKVINDTASHTAGDAIINAIGSVLQARCQTEERVFRTGGDEFALLLAGDPGHAEPRVREFLSAIENFRLGWNGEMLNVTASAGMVGFGAGDIDYASLLSKADAACYTAKELGGNRVVVADRAPDEIADRTEAMRWAVRIRTALDQGLFELDCQTIAPLRPGRETGRHFEVLLRMRDPETRQRLAPGFFIPAAERYRLGTELDRHVVDLVLGWLEKHPDAVAQTATCSINLTGASLADEQFAAFLARRVRGSKVPANRLCFEVTETSAVRDLSRAQRLIADMRALGARFSLDDFGTGFCSFNYLRSLDVDYFKIDGSFVRDLETSPLATAVIRSITDIAHVLDKQTIAEHTETDAICVTLRALGVDFAQGYGIHRPQPIDDYFAPAPSP